MRFAVPFDHLPSLWPYATRAAVWTLVLAVALAFVASTGLTDRPWAGAVAAIAGIGVARYARAIYRLSTPRAMA